MVGSRTQAEGDDEIEQVHDSKRVRRPYDAVYQAAIPSPPIRQPAPTACAPAAEFTTTADP